MLSIFYSFIGIYKNKYIAKTIFANLFTKNFYKKVELR
ncbi:conserved hypothetical protein (plasmid) [Borreliella finlandensis]|uniref:Uncharacterized protein n=1 Tax=Borreliella finlandensis TaxID=498741 RepID=A0A806C847_9SPIR|nr:conserved hypothetical protein [Borreliella finlandensis]